MPEIDYEETYDLEYIVGRPITVDGKDFWPGEDLPAEYVETIPLIESWVNSGYLYRIHPDEDYDRLPPHIYPLVMTRVEAEAALVGDPGITSAIDEAQAVKGEATQVAEVQATRQRVPRRTRRVKPTPADKASAIEVKEHSNE